MASIPYKSKSGWDEYVADENTVAVEIPTRFGGTLQDDPRLAIRKRLSEFMEFPHSPA